MAIRRKECRHEARLIIPTAGYMLAVDKREDAMPRDCEELVLLLLREGNRHDAIKVYQEETGALPDEAREVIGQLATLPGLRRSQWLFVAGVAMAALSCLAAATAHLFAA